MKTDNEIRALAIEMILAVMRSVPPGAIRAMDWWSRARAAMETASGRAEDWPRFVAVMAKKLGIDTYLSVSAQTLSEIGSALTAEEFARLRVICGPQEAVYICAEAQIEKKARRGA